MSELLPCPFCGGEASTSTYSMETWWVSHACYCLGKYVGTKEYATEAEAIAAWNNRAERTCKQLRTFNLIKRECDGKRYSWHGDEMPNYCPNCGARTVGE